MAKPKILLVEDQALFGQQVARALRHQHTVEQSSTVAGAYNLIFSTRAPYELVLLDRSLPDGDGLELVPGLLEEMPSCKICILSVRNSEAERVHGLAYGADDYLVKPIGITELQLRIQNLLRRGAVIRESILTFQELALDLDQAEVRRGGKSQSLSRQQVQYLRAMLQHPHGKASLHRLSQLLVNGESTTAVNAIHTAIQRLRQKLQPLEADIVCHYAHGYQVVVNPERKRS